MSKEIEQINKFLALPKDKQVLVLALLKGVK